MVTPQKQRETVAYVLSTYGVSERHACRVLGVCRALVRYVLTRPLDVDLRERLKAIAKERRRFGYRRLHVLLKRDGVSVNLKKVYRLYTEEGLTVRKRKGRKRALGTRAPLPKADGLNQIWSLDFVSDALSDGRRFRILSVVDQCSRECLALTHNFLPIASCHRDQQRRCGLHPEKHPVQHIASFLISIYHQQGLKGQ